MFCRVLIIFQGITWHFVGSFLWSFFCRLWFLLAIYCHFCFIFESGRLTGWGLTQKIASLQPFRSPLLSFLSFRCHVFVVILTCHSLMSLSVWDWFVKPGTHISKTWRKHDTTKHGKTYKHIMSYNKHNKLNIWQPQEFAGRIVINFWVFRGDLAGSHWNRCHWWCGWCLSLSSLRRSSWYHRGCRDGAAAARGSLWLERARGTGGIGLSDVPLMFGLVKTNVNPGLINP